MHRATIAVVQVNGDATQGGDSGGGWSFGTTAYGGTKGNCFGHSHSPLRPSLTKRSALP
jgi:hypothetical protein